MHDANAEPLIDLLSGKLYQPYLITFQSVNTSGDLDRNHLRNFLPYYVITVVRHDFLWV